MADRVQDTKNYLKAKRAKHLFGAAAIVGEGLVEGTGVVAEGATRAASHIGQYKYGDRQQYGGEENLTHSRRQNFPQIQWFR